MKNENENEETAELSNRLGKRFERKEEPSSGETRRLGDRLAKRIKEYQQGKETTVSTESMGKEAESFFNEFMNLSEKYPELQNTKISELKKIIAQIGMKHPEEVVEELRKRDKEDLKNLDEKWVTY